VGAGSSSSAGSRKDCSFFLSSSAALPNRLNPGASAGARRLLHSWALPSCRGSKPSKEPSLVRQRTPRADLRLEECLAEVHTHAHDFAQFHAALAAWRAPSQNFVYADDRGNIGAISAGYYPLVRHGDPWLPMPGTGADDVAAVRAICEAELAAYLSAVDAARVAPTVVALRAKAATVVDAELARLAGRLSADSLSARALDEIAQTMRRVVDKLLHAPTVRVKELAGSPGGEDYAAALRVLFDLDPRAVEAVTRAATEQEDTR